MAKIIESLKLKNYTPHVSKLFYTINCKLQINFLSIIIKFN